MSERARRKIFIGTVVGNKMDKTVSVMVERRTRHPLYGKFVTKSSKFITHDEENACNVGDQVKIMETRPMSRHKRWRLVEILKKAE